MRRLFLPYGPIHSITIPVAKPEEEGGRPRAKGFAFVWMISKKDAEKAIEGVNGTTLGGERDGDPNGKGKERVIAVDWSLSKERWEVEKERIVEDNSVGEEGEGSDPGSDSEGPDDESDDDQFGVHHDSDGSDSEEDDEGNDDDDPPDRPQLPPPETGNTLFIRNVPFTATEDELRSL